MKKKIILLVIYLTFSFICYSQELKTFNSGTDNCLTIKIPSNWKIYDDDWNAYIKNLVNPKSQKVTIIRASDYDNSTFYFKISYLDMSEKFTKEDLGSEEVDLLNNLNVGMYDLIKSIKNQGLTVKEYKETEYVTIDKAYGGYYSYTYTNFEKQTRTTEIYCVIIGQTAYYITISWDINNSVDCDVIKNDIISNLRLCDLLN